MPTAAAPAKGLHRHLQFLLEPDGIGDVPAVHAEALLNVVHADFVAPNHLVQARAGCGCKEEAGRGHHGLGHPLLDREEQPDSRVDATAAGGRCDTMSGARAA